MFKLVVGRILLLLNKSLVVKPVVDRISLLGETCLLTHQDVLLLDEREKDCVQTCCWCGAETCLLKHQDTRMCCLGL